MNITPTGIVLWLVVLWPLLLSFPVLHTRLPWARQLALLPVLILFLLPTTTTLKLPWVLFGSGLALSADLRWLLAMSIVIWLIAAAQFKTYTQVATASRTTTFFLLTLAGNLGTMLSADLVGFFVFSTLMGYSFYGLMQADDCGATNNAGRCYVMALILGDLALFEALLLAAAATDNLQYASAQQAMADSPTLPLYLGMVLAGFIVKAGLWPAHLWLTAALQTVAPLSRILLAAVPVAMAMLGAIRWLPVGAATATAAGYILQSLGVIMLVHASVKLFRATIIPTTWGILSLIGLFFLLLGYGLVQPSTWRSYSPLAYPYLAIMGISSCIFMLRRLGLIRSRASDKQPAQAGQCLPDWLVFCLGVFQRAEAWRRITLQSKTYITFLEALLRTVTASGGYKRLIPVRGWMLTMAVFILLILVFAKLAV